MYTVLHTTNITTKNVTKKDIQTCKNIIFLFTLFYKKKLEEYSLSPVNDNISICNPLTNGTHYFFNRTGFLSRPGTGTEDPPLEI